MTDQRATIMVVGLDPASSHVIATVVARHEFARTIVAEPGHAARRYEADRPAAVLLDADAGTLPALCELRRIDRDVPILIVSSEIGGNAVIEAMGRGIAGVLRKPLSEAEVERSLSGALDNRRVAAEIASLRSELRSGAPHPLVLGANARMAEVARLVERAADTDATVLIEGEAGTGKDLVARVIHDLSARRAGPFVKVTCGGLPDAALESELYGFERGAFSAAVHHKPGKLDFAHHGTLFLDEVAAMAPALQAKLLLVLQEGAFSRMGSVARVPADARLVATTSTDLAAAVAAGTFREDLYFRLNVVAVVLPPLRERPEDIRALADHFLRTFPVHCNKARPPIGEDTLRLLTEYEWPGNVRELQNTVRRLVLPGGEAEVRRELQRAIAARVSHPAPRERERPVTPSPPVAADDESAATPVAGTLKEIARTAARAAERAAIFKVLQRTRWNRKAAAEFLGISYKALLYKIRENGLDKPAPTS
ncbi:MAG: sigma-54-dependent Fis family transcriptional regulator [Acidobacteria bacterium]|nr:MAG: sigma-54-dependent Fis family transcriptional regulator [Acidobacteriota bacterium]